MRDEKFGYHIYWMVPLYYTRITYDYIVDWNRQRRVKKILKDPEISELSRLAGIKKDKK